MLKNKWHRVGDFRLSAVPQPVYILPECILSNPVSRIPYPDYWR